MSRPADQVPTASNPFGNAPIVAVPVSASAGALMAREAQDIAVQRMMAREFPRDPKRAVDRMLNEFTRAELCEDSQYEYSRGGNVIKGLSIRAAEVIARSWGNMRCGSVELSRGNGRSEMLSYAQDLETGYSEERRFSAAHIRETKSGNYPVTGDRDIYEVVMNMAQRRKRACMLALIPADVQDAVERQIDLTMAAKAAVTPEVLAKLLERFAEFGVVKEQLEKRIQRRLEAMAPVQLIGLRRIYNSLRDNMSEVKDWFEAAQTKPEVSPPAENSSPPAGNAPSSPPPSALSEGAATGAGGASPSPDPPKTGQNQTAKLKEQLRNGKPPVEKAAPTEAHVPFYNKDIAVRELRSAKTRSELELYIKAIWEDYAQSGREIPLDVEAVRNEMREHLPLPNRE